MNTEIAIKEPMKLTADNVEAVFADCLSDERNFIVRGVMINVAFDRSKVAAHEQDIAQMLSALPIEFHRPGGCGWSFLNMCIDKDGQQWCDLHQTIDKLICLGLATGQIEFTLQRDLWRALPGGMPYIVVVDDYHSKL